MTEPGRTELLTTRAQPSSVRPGSSRPARRTRALSASRRAIAELLHGQPQPLTITAIARMTRLHENTIREHLDGLIDKGLVTRVRSTPVGRGRPAWRYAHATAAGLTSEYVDKTERLSSELVAADPEDHAQIAEQVGHDWGTSLATGRGFSATDPALARSQLQHLMDELGFAPTSTPEATDRIRLHNCPVLQAASSDERGMICRMHLGLIRGLLEGGGNPELAAGTELIPFGERGACVVGLAADGGRLGNSLN